MIIIFENEDDEKRFGFNGQFHIHVGSSLDPQSNMIEKWNLLLYSNLCCSIRDDGTIKLIKNRLRYIDRNDTTIELDDVLSDIKKLYERNNVEKENYEQWNEEV